MSAAQGQCPKCKTAQPTAYLACINCGARLPWADAPRATTAPVASTPVALPDPPPVALPPTPSTPPSVAEGLHPIVAVGGLMMGLGLLASAYFFFIFDPSVSGSFMGHNIHVNNIGLLADRQNGILIGMGSAIVGAILFGVGRSLPPPQVAPGNGARLYVILAISALAFLGMIFYLNQQ